MFSWLNKRGRSNTRDGYTSIKKTSSLDQSISTNIEDNIAYLKKLYKQSSDIIFRPFSIGANQNINAFLVAVDGLYDKPIINVHVIKPLMELKIDETNFERNFIKNKLLSLSTVTEQDNMNRSLELLMKGDTLLFIDGWNKVLIIGARSWESRAIEEPVTETTVRGPREAFSETLRTNTSMLRRKIHNSKLQIESQVLGRLSQTDVVIAYIEDIVSPKMLDEVKERLQKIDIDAVLESGYIEELIEDNSFSIFPTVGYTERPDVVAARLLEGRIAVFVEGTPSVIIVPHLMFDPFHSAEDYYSRPYYSSFMRLLRLLSFFIATLLPAIYVAAENYHKEMFPTDLLISAAAAREGVPFPLFIEVFFMTIIFEILKESGVRMPSPLGQAVSIVGGLVLGQAAVDAGFVGNLTVIIIAVTGISTFMTPVLNDAIGLLRLIYLLSAAIFGIYGIMLVFSWLLLHLASLRSFGIPYTSPLFPIRLSGWKDMFVRFPIWALNERGEFIATEYRKTKRDQKSKTTKLGDEEL